MHIRTDKFIITEPNITDVVSLTNLYRDKMVMKYIPNSQNQWSVLAVENKIAQFKLPDIGIHVVKTLNNIFIGEASIFNYSADNSFEIGFIVNKQYWGQGFGKEICKALLDYCINNIKAKKVFARMYKDNLASQKVCLANGMKPLEQTQEDKTKNRITYCYTAT